MRNEPQLNMCATGDGEMVEFNAGSQVKKTTLRQMVTLLVSVWIVVTLAGCGEKQVCHAELEWECNHAELHSFLLRQDLYQYEQARTYCEELTLHGKDDWRLPTDCELMAFASQSQGQIKANALHSRAATC